MEIEIERYESPKVDVYKVTNIDNCEKVGTLNNEHEFNKFRIKMLLNKVTDKYFFMWGEVKITVDEKGNMDKFPRGLYDQVQRDLSEILRITKR